MGREANVFGFLPTIIAVPAGATNSVLVSEQAGEVGGVLKYVSGGSLEILNCPVGTTLSGGSLQALAGTGYLLGTAESINFAGAARFYLCATGATAVAHLLRGMGAGY